MYCVDVLFYIQPWHVVRDSVVRQAPVVTSHNLILPSFEPDATVEESGETDSETTSESWPYKTLVHVPLNGCHNLTVLSDEPDAKKRLLGEKARA